MGTPELIVHQSEGGLGNPELAAGFGRGSRLVENEVLPRGTRANTTGQVKRTRTNLQDPSWDGVRTSLPLTHFTVLL